MSARASAAWHGINIATWLPHCDLWHKYWLGSTWSLWKSSEFLGFQLQLPVLVEIFQQNLPNFCACPFQVCSILLQFGTTWVPCLHQYRWFMAPWPQNTCHCIYHISLSVGPITLQSFPPFTVGESRCMESMHTTRDAQSCQSWAQDWALGKCKKLWCQKGDVYYLYSLKLTANAPETRPSPKEIKFPAINLQMRTVSFREGIHQFARWFLVRLFPGKSWLEKICGK